MKEDKSQPGLNLRFDFNAILALEENGLPIMDGLKDEQLRSLKNMRLLVWAGSLHAKPDMKLEDTRALLAGKPARFVFEEVAKALKEDIGTDEGKEPGPGAPASG